MHLAPRCSECLTADLGVSTLIRISHVNMSASAWQAKLFCLLGKVCTVQAECLSDHMSEANLTFGNIWPKLWSTPSNILFASEARVFPVSVMKHSLTACKQHLVC